MRMPPAEITYRMFDVIYTVFMSASNNGYSLVMIRTNSSLVGNFYVDLTK